jgi:phospholipid/cholesterol/gamma-HCH transport system substrate-binding protein
VIRRTVRIQLVAFLLITVLGIAYAGFQYVGIGHRLINKPFRVTVQFNDATGIYPNAEVTERGVQVGKVAGMSLTKNGVIVKLDIDHGKKIPSNGTVAVLADLSAVGEQYVDLQPTTDSEPFLKNGDSIDATHTKVPLSDATLLTDIDRFVNSVDKRDLTVVIDELNKAFGGTGPDLARLIDSGDSLTQAMQAALPETVRLINDGKTVLDTQRIDANDLASFASNLSKLVHSIREDDPSYKLLIDNGVASAQQLNSLLLDNESALTTLASNLVTVSAIQAVPVRLNGLRYILTIYPSTVYDGFKPAPGDGKAHFAIDTDQSPPNCATTASSPTAPGYVQPPNGDNNAPYAHSNTKGVRRDGSGRYPSTAGIQGKFNAFCNPKSPLYTAGSDVRGAQNAPRPPGDTTAFPPASPAFGPSGFPSGSNSSASASSASASTAPSTTSVGRASTTYDPFTNLFLAPNGQPYLLDTAQSPYYGADSWKWLLVAPTLG